MLPFSRCPNNPPNPPHIHFTTHHSPLLQSLRRFLPPPTQYLILLSVTLPSISAQYDLLFTFRSSFSQLAMTSFTIHALTLLVLVLSVSYEVPPPYLYLTTLFDFCYINIFPVGVIISILEGWRVGSKPAAEDFWGERLEEKKVRLGDGGGGGGGGGAVIC